jgi:hypothetical protein
VHVGLCPWRVALVTAPRVARHVDAASVRWDAMKDIIVAKAAYFAGFRQEVSCPASAGLILRRV